MSVAPDVLTSKAHPPTVPAAPAPLPPAEPRVPRTLCEKACANVAVVLRNELESLPDGGKTLAAEIENASGALCIERCEKLGDPASIACVTAARSALELGACEGQAPSP